MISLTRRITLGTVVLTSVVVGVAVLAVWSTARWQAVRALDRELSEHAGLFQRLAVEGGPRRDGGLRPPPWLGQRPPPPGLGRVLVRIIEPASGTERFRMPGDEATLTDILAATGAGLPAWFRQGDGRRLRGLRVDLAATTSAPAVTGAFAIDASATLGELERLAATLGAVWLVASCLAVLAAWWLHRSVLGPLRRLATAISAVGPGRAGTRIDTAVPQEMTTVVSTLNELLDRQAALLAREKGTIANIAHELRSPISGLRTTLEVAVLDTGSADAALAARCLPTVVAMHGLVVNLLALARLEAGQEQVAFEDVLLDDLLTAGWASVQPAAVRRRQHLERRGAGGWLRTCPDKARMVIGNLLDNAVAHAPEGGVLDLTCDEADGRVWLHLGNALAGPAPDPFWRGDGARSSPLHSGLGLALARRLTVALGGELRVEVGAGRFTVHLGLPAAP